jgi:protein-disulfide isomerase
MADEKKESSEHHEHSEHKHHESKSSKKRAFSKKMKGNPWIIATFILAIILVLVLGTSFNFSNVSKEKASEDFVEFINSGGSAQIEYVSSKDYSAGLYEVTVESNGQEVPVYITKDGKYFVQIISPITSSVVEEESSSETQETETQEIPKSDKPVVELFIMSHCPYGTQAEKGMLPVVELLGDKIDFDLKFVYYAMHPNSGEVQEQLNQYCIQEEQEELFNDYLRCFLGTTGTPEDAEVCRAEVGIDEDELSSCYSRVDEEYDVIANLEDKDSWMSGRRFPLFNIHKDLNEEYGVRGSPTLVINGEQVSSGRAPASYLSAICQAFNDAPEECSESLSTASPSPGFGWSESSSGSTDAQCG